MADPTPPTEGRREPKVGEVWREKRRQYARRKVVVMQVVTTRHDAARGVHVQSITDYSGKPVTARRRPTVVALHNWHRYWVFDSNPLEATR